MLPALWNVALIILFIKRVDNKAMMIEPPHRSSLWRYDKTAPVNTKDDMLNCGGYEVQWEENSGMCDVCGHPFDALFVDDRDYAVVRSYNQGAYVNVTVEVNSNLLGFFEFRLCPRNTSKELISHECFERNMLWIEESWSTRYYVGSHGGIFDLHVRLPADISCSNCVFQWKYSTGYRMGGINECQCMGCGRQETFFNCADIEIKADNLFQQGNFESTEINIHSPLFLISGKNLTDSSIEQLRETLPTFKSPLAVEIRKGKHTFRGPTLSYKDTVLLRQNTKELFRNVVKDTLTDIQNKPILFNWTRREMTSQMDNPFVQFTNMSFPIRIFHGKQGNIQSQSFWDKIFKQPKPSVFWETVTKNPKPSSFWDKIALNTAPRILVKPKTTDIGRVGPKGFMSGHSNMYRVQSSGDSIIYPLFPVLKQAGTSKNGDCYASSPNFRCKGKGQHSNTIGIDKWCLSNCRSNHCVKFMCECGCDDVVVSETKCHAIGAFEDIYGMDEWCTQICSQKSCPANICSVKDCQNGS